MKKKIKQAGVCAALLLCLTLFPAVTANAGFRRQADGKYRYYTSQTSYIRNDFMEIHNGNQTDTYYFDAQGNMVTGWKQIRVRTRDDEGTLGFAWHWYYFDSNGRMLKDYSKNDHYLKEDGRMASAEWIDTNYYSKDGVLVPGYQGEPGFQKVKKDVKYRKADGKFAAKEWRCIKGDDGKYHWQYFYSNGKMAKNTWVGSRHVDQDGKLDSLRKESTD